jgi:starvation-inducible DNA-binding protein
MESITASNSNDNQNLAPQTQGTHKVLNQAKVISRSNLMSETQGKKMYPTHIDIPADLRAQLIDLLNQQLADIFDLYSQTKQAHWNVKGMQFFQLHELFDDLAESVLEYVDMIAERGVSLGGVALGTARLAAANSSLPELPLDLSESRAFVEALVERYGQYAGSVRRAIDQAEEAGDKDTADLFTEVSRAIDKQLWFLEAHIQA